MPPPRSMSRPSAPAALRPFHPVVREWFVSRVGTPSAPQRQGWPTIATGAHTLVLAPTGTGKTLAAFLWELDRLIREGLERPLANAVHVLYVSPLKALNNDVRRNLEGPLAELRDRFEAAGHRFPEIRIAVRTGDTPSRERQRMLTRTPHILITTPESLHILLTSLRGRELFSALRAVIIDEIHAVAGTKRGAHLALTLERLEKRCSQTATPSPQRIGLSATQRPLDEIARFLGGTGRAVSVVDCGLVKEMDVGIVSPVANLNEIGGTIWPAVYPLLLERIRASRTTLVFVNNRAQAERIAAKVNALAQEEVALPYHGSLARERRLLLESRLKAGELRALVATSSLELGIDIGSVDLVVQVGSPKRVASGLQRVGRAGHSLDAVSRGTLIPLFRDDGLEILALADGMREGDVEPTHVVQNALDVLAQVIVAAASVEDWTADDLFALARAAYPYHALTRGAFDEVLAMLSGKYPADLASELEARVVWDRVTGQVTGSRAGRMAAVISGGTIPDRGYYTVNLPDRTRLGELDEEFVHESRIGDVFQLGSSTWRIQALEHDRVIVVPAPGAPARMPFWHGEFMARSAHLTPRMGNLRRELACATTDEDIRAIAVRHRADEATARSLVEYVRRQRLATGVVPDDRVLVLEEFRDDVGAVRLVLHAPFGGRVNAPWGMALAQRAREALGRLAASRELATDVQVQTTDDGIMLRLPDLGAAVPADALLGLGAEEAERRVIDEVGSSSLFGARFRMNAARALLLPRGSPRRRMPLWLQRLKALDLLQVVRAYPGFPILIETYRDVLADAFDMPALTDVLDRLARGEIRVQHVRTEVPSPFAASLQFGFVMDWLYGDDTPRAEQRAALLSLDRALLDELMGGEGADDRTLEHLSHVLRRRRGTLQGTRARSADELAVLIDRAGDVTGHELRERIALPDEGVRGDPAAALAAAERTLRIRLPVDHDAERIILAETYPRYLAAYGPALECAHEVSEALRHPVLTRGAARREILLRHITLADPFSLADLSARYGFPESWTRMRLEEWQRAGRLVHGTFGGDRAIGRWVSRRMLEIARRRELAAATRTVEAASLAAYAAFLLRWQHVDPRDRLEGPDAVRDVLSQLQGPARPAEAWERDYLPARIAQYDPADLSRLTASGRFVWIGGGSDGASGHGTLSNLRFIERGSGARWLIETADPKLSAAAQGVLEVLARLGASFIEEIERAASLGPNVVRSALRELAAASLVTNDTADAMREVLRWRGMLPGRPADVSDPTRWLPADFSPGANRPIVQRRLSLQRLPKWRRPDRMPVSSGWLGRWSLVRTAGVLGHEEDEGTRAAAIATQLLARYGIVSRDAWRRERPAVEWRAVYRELRRLEFRGDVRRGYFVRGLSGIQFALPAAVDMLRAAASEPPGEQPLVAVAASDPANPFSLHLTEEFRVPLGRPRGRGGLVVLRGGVPLLSAAHKGRRIDIAAEATPSDVAAAVETFVAHTRKRPGRRDVIVERIGGIRATASMHASTFRAAGFRDMGGELRLYASPE